MPSSANQVYYENGVFVDYYGMPIPMSVLGSSAGVVGATRPTGATGEMLTTSAGLTTKFVKEFFPVGPSTISITRSEIESALGDISINKGYVIINPLVITDLTFELSDMSISIWAYDSATTDWILCPSTWTGNASTTINKVHIDTTSGDIDIDYNYPANPLGQRIRVIIII